MGMENWNGVHLSILAKAVAQIWPLYVPIPTVRLMVYVILKPNMLLLKHVM
jgi:hypothetical protein